MGFLPRDLLIAVRRAAQKPVEDRKTFTTLVCPMCKRAWFHRDCIQVGALPQPRGTAGAQQQHRASLTLPVFALQGQALRAGALYFQCPLCQLLLCCSCAAEGTHRRCSGLRNSTQRWECDSCAGLGTSAARFSQSPSSGGSLPTLSWEGVEVQRGLGSGHEPPRPSHPPALSRPLAPPRSAHAVMAALAHKAAP
ncbi:LOW QUALITY PROTEIN: PHD finger protein 7-like [Ammospiza maritima maritima]